MAKYSSLLAGVGTVALTVGVAVCPVGAAEGEAPVPDMFSVDFSENDETEMTNPARDLIEFREPTLEFDGKIGQKVAFFDGDDAYSYEFNGNELEKVSTGVTIECSFRYQSDFAPNEVSVCGTKNGGGFVILVNDGKVQFSLHDGNGYQKAETPITPDTWYHVVGVFDGTSAKLYVNGELRDEIATGPKIQMISNQAARRFVIGADTGARAGKPFTDNPMRGWVESAHVWSRPLTEDEVASRAGHLYRNSSMALPTADVLDVDTDRGGFDDLAIDRPYRTDGDVKFVEDKALERTVANFNNTAVIYQVGDEWLDKPNGDGAFDIYDNLKKGFSVECTFKFNGPLPSTGEAGVCSNKQGGGFSLGVYKDYATFAVNTKDYNYARKKIEPYQWYHAVGVFDPFEQKARLYLNGELVDEITTGTNKLYPPKKERAKIWTLGADAGDGSAQYHGNISLANSKIYSSILKPEEVAALNSTMLGDAEPNSLILKQPKIASTSPSDGAKLTNATHFSVAWDNPDLVAPNIRYTLDGSPLKEGDLIGPNITAGEHVIRASGRTVFGSPIQQSVRFTSGNIVSSNGTDEKQGDGVATLMSAATNASGGDVTTTFYKGRISSAEKGTQGVITEPPSKLEFDAENIQTIGGNGSTDEVAPGKIPFQRFDVPVSVGKAHQQINWRGRLDSRRQVQLQVWNFEKNSWDEIASANGQDEDEFALSGLLGEDHIANGVAHVLVLGTDPFLDDRPNEIGDSFEQRDSYDFSLVHMTDTQFVAERATNPKLTEEERGLWAKTYRDQLQWIVDKQDDLNIQYVANSGDLIESWVLQDYGKEEPAKKEQSLREFAFIDNANREVLDAAEIPYGVLPGNHDNREGTENGPTNLFNSNGFGPLRFEKLAQSDGWKSKNVVYSPWKPGDNDNHYDLFTAKGRNGETADFIVVYLGYGVTQEEADWASSVLQEHSDRNGIIVAHSYGGPSNAPDGRDGYLSYDGDMIQSNVVDPNPNVALVLSGHENGVAINVRQGVGDPQHNTLELMSDYQEYKIPAGDFGLDAVTGKPASSAEPLGSNFLRVLQFDLANSELAVDTYSPELNKFRATDYDGRNRYDGREDDFRVPIQLNTRKTSFTTSSVVSASQTDEIIGEQTVRSGWPASVEWSGLREGDIYAWYAVSRDADESAALIGEVTQADVFTAQKQSVEMPPEERDDEIEQAGNGKTTNDEEQGAGNSSGSSLKTAGILGAVIGALLVFISGVLASDVVRSFLTNYLPDEVKAMLPAQARDFLR